MASEPRYMTLPKLFSGHLFRVPDYQRGYAWTRRQLDDLWTDIELLDDHTQHFTGMIVVESLGDRQNPDELETYQVLEVIDGQQRLTTLVLLVQAIVRSLESLDDKDANKIASRLQARYVGSTGWFRLRLNDDSRVYFEHLLAEGEPLVHTENGSQRNLHGAVTYFREKLDELGASPEERLSGIRALVSRLQSNLRFVFYEVDDDAEAGLIFEVMNNRGKDLSQADRLKNYLMYLAHKVGLSEDDVKGIAGSWGEVFKQVMRSSPDGVSSIEVESRLLRNHWILYKEAQFPKEYRGLSISQRIRQELLLKPVPSEKLAKRDKRLGQGALRYTRSLVTTSNDFAELFNPASPGALTWVKDKKISEALRREMLSFHQMGHTATATPLLLAGRRRLGDRPGLLLKLTRALSTYCFRVYAMCNHRGHTGQAHFRRLARDLFAGKKAAVATDAQYVIDEVYGWAEYYGGDEELEGNLQNSNFYSSHGPQEIRYLFFEYEIEVCHGQEPSLDWAAFSNSKTTQVEHIWARATEWLGGEKKLHEKNVNRLGNLTVSHFNQTLGKKEFAKKRKIYAKSSLVIENSLQRHRSWGLRQVERRERKLVEFVLRRWALPDDDDGEDDE